MHLKSTIAVCEIYYFTKIISCVILFLSGSTLFVNLFIAHVFHLRRIGPVQDILRSCRFWLLLSWLLQTFYLLTLFIPHRSNVSAHNTRMVTYFNDSLVCNSFNNNTSFKKWSQYYHDKPKEIYLFFVNYFFVATVIIAECIEKYFLLRKYSIYSLQLLVHQSGFIV